MTHTPNQNHEPENDSSLITGDQAKAIGLEYQALLAAPTLTEAQDARFTEILELAITHNEVDLWVAHLTCLKGMEDGLLAEAATEEYENQKALLRERIGQAGLAPIRGRASQPIQEQLLEQIEDQKVATFKTAIKNLDRN